MTRDVPPFDSARDCNAEAAALIQRGQEMLAQFQAWAAAELRVMKRAMEQTRIVIEETERCLMQPGSIEA